MRYYQTLQAAMSPILLDENFVRVRALSSNPSIGCCRRCGADRVETEDDGAVRSEKMKDIDVAYAEVQSCVSFVGHYQQSGPYNPF